MILTAPFSPPQPPVGSLALVPNKFRSDNLLIHLINLLLVVVNLNCQSASEIRAANLRFVF